jgi:hypothetical protein
MLVTVVAHEMAVVAVAARAIMQLKALVVIAFTLEMVETLVPLDKLQAVVAEQMHLVVEVNAASGL